jgi:hypothetical protein
MNTVKTKEGFQVAMKSEMLKYGSNECWLATVYQIQLYGDPTLKYKGE